MTEKKTEWASIEMRPFGGTARFVSRSRAIPQHKEDKEVFWATALAKALPNVSSKLERVISNPDDSHGKHDVIFEMKDGNAIGIQVTELTSELKKKRAAIRASYLPKLLEFIQEKSISSRRKVVMQIFVTGPEVDFKRLSPKHILKAMQEVNFDNFGKDEVGDVPTIVEKENFRLFFTNIGESDFYVPHINNIGVDVDFDLLPRTISGYQKAIDSLAEKKSSSKSSWLLIWSTDFIRDKHWLEEDVIQHMKAVFQPSHFTHVYFAESSPIESCFIGSLEVYRIKETIS